MATNLYSFYQSKGQALPSLSDRSKLYAQHGLTGTYSGTTQQNNDLLGKLMASSVPPPAPPTPDSPPPPDYTKNYAQITGLEDLQSAAQVNNAKNEAGNAKANRDKAFQDEQTTQQNAISSADTLFNNLFKGPEITQFRDQATKAYADLQQIDAEQAKVENDFKVGVQANGNTPSWAAQAQLGIIQNTFNAKRSAKAAEHSIAKNNYDDAYKYATDAYNHGLTTLQTKIDLAKTALDNATNLSTEAKADYATTLTRAENALTTKKADQKASIDTFLTLAQAGVTGITPDMTTAQMSAIAGPTLVKQAQADIALKNKKAQAETDKLNAETAKLRSDSTPSSGGGGPVVGGVTLTGGPKTDVQRATDGYATRISEANNVFSKTESYISKLSPGKFTALRNTPGVLNFTKPAEFQQQEQAEKNFLNAVLRRESGAAISDSEFKSGRDQYFPQPGDSVPVLAQKKKSRETAYTNLLKEAGYKNVPTTTTSNKDPLGILN